MNNNYIENVMNYTGSKFKILDQILPSFDYRKPIFVDLFAGGGSVFLNVLDKYEYILVNDIIVDLIGIHSSILESDDIINSTKMLCPDKNNKYMFHELRDDYNLNPSPDKLWALVLCSNNNMLRFNKKMKYNMTYGNRTWNANTDKKVSEYKEHIRKFKSKINFTSTSFQNIDVFENMMIYADPPYLNTEAGYNSFWNKNDDNILYDYLINANKIGASFVLSGVISHNGKKNDLLQNLIDYGFNYEKIEIDYNQVSKIGKKETIELIIKNF